MNLYNDFKEKSDELIKNFPFKNEGAVLLIFSKLKKDKIKGESYISGCNFAQLGQILSKELIENPVEYYELFLSTVHSYVTVLDDVHRTKFINEFINYLINIDKEIKKENDNRN